VTHWSLDRKGWKKEIKRKGGFKQKRKVRKKQKRGLKEGELGKGIGCIKWNHSLKN